MTDDTLDPYYLPVSKAWYLLPIFLGIVGGVTAWLVLRNKNPPQARKMLVVGAAVLGAFVAIVAVGMFLDGEPSEAEDADAQLDDLPKGLRLLHDATTAYAVLVDTLDPDGTANSEGLLLYITQDMTGRLALIDSETHILHDVTEDTCDSLDTAIYIAYNVMEFDRLYEPGEDLSGLSDGEFYDIMTQRSLLFLDLSDDLYPLVYDNIEAWDKLYIYLADAYNDSSCVQYN